MCERGGSVLVGHENRVAAVEGRFALAPEVALIGVASVQYQVEISSSLCLGLPTLGYY